MLSLPSNVAHAHIIIHAHLLAGAGYNYFVIRRTSTSRPAHAPPPQTAASASKTLPNPTSIASTMVAIEWNQSHEDCPAEFPVVLTMYGTIVKIVATYNSNNGISPSTRATGRRIWVASL